MFLSFLNVFDSNYILVQAVGVPYVLEWLLGFFSCVLTVGISPTKSMSTKNPKLGNTFFNTIYIYTIQRSSTCVYFNCY